MKSNVLLLLAALFGCAFITSASAYSDAFEDADHYDHGDALDDYDDAADDGASHFDDVDLASSASASDDDDDEGDDDDDEGDVLAVEVDAPTPTAPCDCSCHVSDASADEPYACSCKCPIVKGYPGPVGPRGPRGRRGPTGHQGVQGARGPRGPTGALAAGTHMASHCGCYHESWMSTMDRRGWSTCTKPGYFITGLWRNTGTELFSIEWARCCRSCLVV